MDSQIFHMLKQAAVLIFQPDMSSKGSGCLKGDGNTISTRKPVCKRKCAVVLTLLMRGKYMNHTLNSPIMGSVNYVTDVHKLAPVFSLNSSKCSLFYVLAHGGCERVPVTLPKRRGSAGSQPGPPPLLPTGNSVFTELIKLR